MSVQSIRLPDGPPVVAPADRTARRLARAGLVAIAACVVLIVALHRVDPTLDPVRLMLSEYVYGRAGWMFDSAVLLLVAGSVAVLAAGVRAGLVPARSRTAALLSVWTASLVVIVACRTSEHGGPLTVSGVFHGVASTVGFCALPAAALRIARARRGHPRWGRHSRAVTVLAVASAPWLVPLVVPVVVAVVSSGTRVDPSYWAGLPFGLVQRGLAVTEVAVLAALGVWASRFEAVPA